MTLHGTICQNPEYLALLMFLNSMMWVPSLSVSWCTHVVAGQIGVQVLHRIYIALHRFSTEEDSVLHKIQSIMSICCNCREDVSRDEQHRSGQESAAESDHSARPCQPFTGVRFPLATMKVSLRLVSSKLVSRRAVVSWLPT